MPSCSVKGCKTRRTKDRRLFVMPTIPSRRNIWTKFCNKPGWIAKRYSRICEEHFSLSQFECNRQDGWMRLKLNAVPDIPMTKDNVSKNNNIAKAISNNQMPSDNIEAVTNYNDIIMEFKEEPIDTKEIIENLYKRIERLTESLKEARKLLRIEKNKNNKFKKNLKNFFPVQQIQSLMEKSPTKIGPVPVLMVVNKFT